MKKILFFLMIILSASCFGNQAVKCKLNVYQYDADSRSDVLIFADTVTFIKNVAASGFIGPMSVEIEFLEIDSIRSVFNIHLVTLHPIANTLSKKFTIEYNLPARIDKIICKNNSSYSLLISPLEKIDIDTSFCAYNHRKKDIFTYRPTAYTDLHYVESSLGDYHWDSIKELIETNYRQFLTFSNINLPGKILVYLYPCPSHSIIWDKRFGMSSDPTRNSAYSIYNKTLNTTDPFVVIHTAVLRNFGYAPPFLAEGLANYFSFAPYDMQLIIDENKQMPLREIMETIDYLNKNPFVADRTAATFVKYLVDQYSFDKFNVLYKAADDINLASQIEKVYNKSIDSLEVEWLNYLDTLQIHPMTFSIHSSLAEMMFNYETMLKYSNGYYNNALTAYDTTESLNSIKRAYFNRGDYYKTADYMKKIIKRDTTNQIEWMALGSYRMMCGEYDEAFECFTKAKSLDSLNHMINFNLALYYSIKGENNKARKLLVNNITNTQGTPAQGETLVLLANILSQSEKKSDLEKASEYYSLAIRIFNQSLQTNPSASPLLMWSGIAYAGMYDYKNALDFLHTAEFIETRPFYIGMINLWLGKVNIATGDKDIAGEYFNKVLSNLSADYHQNEAREYLK